MDIISDLSDELLLQILLLVPTKVAVSTSILSKRWEYLWMSLPKLDYSSRNCSESECERLRCFLDRNMRLHRAPVIQSFRFELCGSLFTPEDINIWIVNAVYHCVRELDILHEDTDPSKSNILPSNLFTCKSLVILKLEGWIVLDVPQMVSLPSLKTLKLQYVRFFNAKTLVRLLSNCPILEDLVVMLQDYDTTRKLTVVAPSLQSLSIFIPYYNALDGVVIKTPSLKSFKLIDYRSNDHYCLIEHMPDLIEAHLDADFLDISSLIRSISSVKRLKICSEAINDVSFVFNELEHLEVCLCTVLLSNQLVRLLEASSKLQGLNISFMDVHIEPSGMKYMDDWNQPSTVPKCMLSSLESLNWSPYTGEPQEKEIVAYILKHALHLKTATIKSSECNVPKFEMLQELALSSRASATCQLMFN